MNRNFGLHSGLLFVLAVGLLLSPALAGYKARPWNPRPIETYPARLKSEGVTIAAEPLWNDAMASRIFDKDDMVQRGIMPLAVIIFNDNDFPVLVEGSSIELIRGGDHLLTMPPREAVFRLFLQKNKEWVPQPMPRLSTLGKKNEDALVDFREKFLGDKLVEPHKTGGGFLYLHLPGDDLKGCLSESTLYIPNILRQDSGERMIFFEIDLAPSVQVAPPAK